MSCVVSSNQVGNRYQNKVKPHIKYKKYHFKIKYDPYVISCCQIYNKIKYKHEDLVSSSLLFNGRMQSKILMKRNVENTDQLCLKQLNTVIKNVFHVLFVIELLNLDNLSHQIHTGNAFYYFVRTSLSISFILRSKYPNLSYILN